MSNEEGLLIPALAVSLEAYDAEGNMLKRIHFPAHSWTANFYEMLEMVLAPQLTSGYLASYAQQYSLTYKAFAGTKTWDSFSSVTTQIGIGNSNVAFDKLQTKLQGTIVYWNDLDGYEEDTSKAVFKTSSIGCAEALTIKEVGFRWASVKDYVNEVARTVMFERSVLASADFVDVPAGGRISASYELALP